MRTFPSTFLKFLYVCYFVVQVTSGNMIPGDCANPKEWEPLNGSCIYISDDSHSWNHSRTNCEQLRATLVSIGDRNKNDEIVQLLNQTLAINASSEFHIGLRHQNGSFLWTDNTKYNFSDWSTQNKTNATVPSNNGNTLCAYYSREYVWKQENCSVSTKNMTNATVHSNNATLCVGNCSVSAQNKTNSTAVPSNNDTLCAGHYDRVYVWRLGNCSVSRRYICQRNFRWFPAKNNKTKSSPPTTTSATTPNTTTPAIATTPNTPTPSVPGNKGKDAENVSKSQALLDNMTESLSNLIKPGNMTTDDMSKIVSQLENLGKDIIDDMKKAGKVTEPQTVKVESDELVIEISLLPTTESSTLLFPLKSSSGNIVLPNTVIQRAAKTPSNSDGVGITSLFLPGVGKGNDKSNAKKPVLNSGLISTKFYVPAGTMDDLADPVVISLTHAQSLQPNEKQVCAFIDESTSQFSTKGCIVASSNSTFTVCHCSHLTSFAVLMDVHGMHDEIPDEHKVGLLVVSIVGCCIALVCFVAALVCFHLIVSVKRLRRKTETVAIHKNLAIAEIFALTFFLAAYGAVINKGLCFAVAFALHYFLMAVFLWMMIEGLNLHRGMVKVFVTSSRMRVYRVLGWVVPLVFVVTTAAVGQMEYARNDFCWISPQFIWVFAGPVAAILFINFVILCIAIRVMVRRPRSKINQIHDTNNSYIEQELRIAFKTTVILLPLLGLTWCLGFFATHTSTGNIVIQYLFAIINSLQGVYFFLAHCWYDEDVNKVISHQLRNLRNETGPQPVSSASSRTSTRIKTFFSRTVSRSGPSRGSASNSNQANGAYCNTSFRKNNEHLYEMPSFPAEISNSHSSSDVKTPNKISVSVLGDYSLETSRSSRYPAYKHEPARVQPVDFSPAEKSKENHDTDDKQQIPNSIKTDTTEAKKGSPKKWLYRRSKSTFEKKSTRNKPARRASSMTTHGMDGPRPLVKQISVDSSQSGNSNTSIL